MAPARPSAACSAAGCCPPAWIRGCFLSAARAPSHAILTTSLRSGIVIARLTGKVELNGLSLVIHPVSDRLLVDRKCSNPSVTPLSAYGEVGGASGQGWLPRPPRHSGAAIATSNMSVPTQPWPGFQGSASARPTRTATFHLVLFCAGGHLAPRGPSTVTSDGTTGPHRHICGRDFLGRSYWGSDSPLARSAGAPGNGLVSPSHRRASGSHTHRRR